jgi:hypothetical protein
MGKCYSMVDRGQRKKNDAYSTPYSITQQFLDAEYIPIYYRILEPCCGDGAILDVLNKNGYRNVHGYDIQGYRGEQGCDFLLEPDRYDYVLSNPPYSLAFEFIQKAKRITDHEFAFLLPLGYLHGKRRFDEIWQDKEYPLDHIWVFTRYPMLGDKLREDGKYRTGMQIYAFYVWEKGSRKEYPEIRWIDNDKYVLRRKDDCTASSGD